MSNDEIWREFLLETHENLALLDADLIRLETHPTDKGTLAQVFRTLHSVKGTAGFMGLVKLQAIAHSAESLLSRLRAGELLFNRPIATALLQVVDAIRAILNQIETNGGEGSGDYTALADELDWLREGKADSAPADHPSPTSAAPTAPIASPAANQTNRLNNFGSPTHDLEESVERFSTGNPWAAGHPSIDDQPALLRSQEQAEKTLPLGQAQDAPTSVLNSHRAVEASLHSAQSDANLYAATAELPGDQLGLQQTTAVMKPTPATQAGGNKKRESSPSASPPTQDAGLARVADLSTANAQSTAASDATTGTAEQPQSAGWTKPTPAPSGYSATAVTIALTPGLPSERQFPQQAGRSESNAGDTRAQSFADSHESRSKENSQPRTESAAAHRSSRTGLTGSVSNASGKQPSSTSWTSPTTPSTSTATATTSSSSAFPVPASTQGTSTNSTVDFSEPRSGGIADSTIRVDVGLLDRLMTLVGELVLARNQILQYSAAHGDDGFLGAVQRLNLLTSDLQAGVMKTRMQPIGTVLGKFPRIVRDLAVACGKQVQFELDGQETELDKTLLEAIRDPLTHLVRNAVDHGIEAPAVRETAGKPAAGRLRMVAFHEGGKVIIEITDDGAGIQVDRVREKAIANKIITPDAAARMSRQELLQLIFLPGFSTAEKVTQFSGRGVGMDVVRTNMERIGGTVEIESTPGQGTTIRSKIPLTLAIIPALIISSGGQRYAIPQVSLLELVHLDADQARRSVERMYDVPVYRLRGELLPLVFLNDQLGLARPMEAASELSIVVLQADDRPFGLVVDAIRDTEEIVVKPLQKQIKGIELFAGAAIMGDGRVALVLDVLGLARRAQVVSGARSRVLGDLQRTAATKADEAPPALLVQSRQGEQMAIPLAQVARLEEFAPAQFEQLGGRTVVQYRGSILPLIELSTLLSSLQDADAARPWLSHQTPFSPADLCTTGSEQAAMLPVVVHGTGQQQVGLIVGQILDIAPVPLPATTEWSRPGTLFTSIVQDRVTEMIDVPQLVSTALQAREREDR